MDDLRISLERPSELRLAGDLDISTIADAAAAFDAIKGSLRLDLSELDFIDSMGIALLAKRLRISPLVLVHAPPRLHRMLRLAGLTVGETGELSFEDGAA